MSLIEESRRRIVTTNVGSLPRRHSLSDLLLARLDKQPYDPATLARETTEAVAEVVHKQLATGIDIVSDGEQSKTSFQNYIADRLTGLEPITPQAGRPRNARKRGVSEPIYKTGAHSGSAHATLACTGPIRYVGHKQLAADIDNFKAALQGQYADRGIHSLGVAIELRRH